jgi:hypothetical protein
MSVTEIKEQLHKVIESIQDEEFLEALLTITSSQKQPHDYPLTAEQIQILEERHEGFLKGEEKTSTIEEFKEKLRRKYGF